MKALTVAEVKSRFSEVLLHVKNGENCEVLYGKARKPIAMIVPIEVKPVSRQIGILDGKAKFTINGDGKISEKEFLGI